MVGRLWPGREWAALLVLMLAYAALFLVYYPPLSGIEDEVGFVNQALVWSRGAVTSEGAGLPGLADFVPVAGRHVALRNPGRSLLALPFLTLGGVPAVFASGLVLHLTLTFLAARLLARLGHSPLWAALVLFHPTLAIYSRTMMADEAAGTGLLLAALMVTRPGPAAGVWAGLAVGLGALARYHAGLALPVVAAAFRFPKGRPHPWRDAALCLVSGGLAGGAILAYNLILYHHPTQAARESSGLFSSEFLIPQATFYATALLAIWPAMLLAPVFDRSSVRWLVRGVCALYFAFLSFYYFHDRGPGWLETLVVGQRLMQVALPLWIVSYAGVVDDWLARPLRRRLDRRLWAFLVALGCTGLLAVTGMMFSRHQGHLARLRAARDAMVATVPSGSLVVANNVLIKLFGIPQGLPSYRFRLLDFQDQPLNHSRELQQEHQPWYLAILPRVAGSPLPPDARDLVEKYHLEPVPSSDPGLSLYVAHPANQR